MIDLWPIRTALLSCTDKTGLIPLAQELQRRGVKIVSTGGTGQVLREAGIGFQEISEFTGHPESFKGRMKTISFKAASGLLYRRQDPADCMEAQQLGIEAIDLVVCNLYPFEEVMKKNPEEAELIENIDIGGPLMIRSAAKNFASVTVLSDPAQYTKFIGTIVSFQGQTPLEYRKTCAMEAFTRIAAYDVAIAEELTKRIANIDLPSRHINLTEGKRLRYGENPHQKSHIYLWDNTQGPGLGRANIIQGKELSFNNILDSDAAWKSVSELHHLFVTGASCVVIKHGNPCGLVHGKSALEVIESAWAGDPVSAFGSIIAIDTVMGEKEAAFFNDKFVEILLAPKFSPEALKILSAKKNLRLLELPLLAKVPEEMTLRSFNGGVLVQMEDEGASRELKQVTKNGLAKITPDLCHFGIIAGKYLKSNGIALVKETNGLFELVGAGMGQPNRLDSLLKLALPRMREKNISPDGVVMVSDAFFPFKDTVEVAADNGIRFIVQPGGSIRDEEVVKAADDLGVAMFFTGERHFRH